eukprot:COSAG06_NODE_1899_length_8112_cov_7.981904_11_plen_150_part_00
MTNSGSKRPCERGTMARLRWSRTIASTHDREISMAPLCRKAEAKRCQDTEAPREIAKNTGEGAARGSDACGASAAGPHGGPSSWTCDSIQLLIFVCALHKRQWEVRETEPPTRSTSIRVRTQSKRLRQGTIASRRCHQRSMCRTLQFPH